MIKILVKVLKIKKVLGVCFRGSDQKKISLPAIPT